MSAEASTPRARPLGARTFAATFLASGAYQALGVVSGILVARLLGPVGRGEIATIYNYASIVALIGSLGIQQAVAYTVSRSATPGPVAGAGLKLALWLGSVEAILTFFLVPILMPPDKLHLIMLTRVFMLYVPLNFVVLTFLGAEQGAGNFRRFNLFKVLPAAIYVALIVALYASGGVSVSGLVGANLVSQAAVILIMWLVSAPTAGSDRREVFSLAKLGVVFQLPQVFGILLDRLDILLCVALLPVRDVGFYAVAVAVAQAQQIVTSTFVQVGFVRVARNLVPEDAIAELMLQFRILQPLVLGAAIILLLASPLIVSLAFGSQFSESLPIACWLVGAVAIGGLATVLDNGLRALKQTDISTVAYVAGCATIVAMCVSYPSPSGLLIAKARLTSAVVVLLVKIALMKHRNKMHFTAVFGFTPRTFAAATQTIRRGLGLT